MVEYIQRRLLFSSEIVRHFTTVGGILELGEGCAFGQGKFIALINMLGLPELFFFSRPRTPGVRVCQTIATRLEIYLAVT